MIYGSVCSGIEAATAAWHPLGWKSSFFSEIDAFPRAVLEHHYPDVPLHGDFTTIQDSDYEPIELLVGGTPCQSFSVAGLRKGLDDPRGNLMLGFGALAKRLRPTWLVWENVPGVLSANRGRDFGTFLGMLGQLGYGFAYRVLDAQYFGVAQRRRRVFVVGYLGDWRPAAAVLFERHSLSGHPAPSREAGESIAADVAPSLTASGRGVERCGESRGQDPVVAVARMRGFGDYEVDELASTLKSRDAKDATDLVTCVHGTQDPCVSDQAHTLGRNNGQENALFVSLRGRDGGATAELGGPIAGTLRAATGGGDKPHVMCFAENSRSEVRLEGGDGSRAGALSTGGGKPGQGMPVIAQGITIHGTDKTAKAVSYTDLAGALRARPPGSIENSSTTAVHDKMAVRRLTPVECERLQGFPEIVESEEIWVSATAQEHSQLQAAAVAGQSFGTSLAGHGRPALVSVHIDSERRAVEIRSAGKLICSVSSADELSRSPQLTLIADSALALAGLSTTLVRRTRTGKAESPVSMQSSIHRRSGSKPVVVFGQEIAERASGAEKTVSEAIKFITSPDGWTHQSCDTLMTILSCSVAHAIAGFIPEITPQKSFCIQIEAKHGFTKIPYRNKSADKCPDGPRYKALGNSMAVPVMAWIGYRINHVNQIITAVREAA